MFEIAKKTFLTNLRGSKYVLFNALFPIFLMILIGTALTNAFTEDRTIEKLIINYYDQGNNNVKQILETIKNNSGDIDVELREINSIEKGKEITKLGEGIFVHLNNSEIDIYTNDKRMIDSAIANTLFRNISSRYNVIDIAIENLPQKADEIARETIDNSSIQIDKIPAEKTPTSYDYYGVTELTLITVYMSLFPLYSMKNDKKYRLKDRLRLTGISNIQYYLGSLVGYIGLGIIGTLPGFIFSLVVLKTNWGNNIALAYLSVLTLTTMFITMGMVVECLFKDNDRASGLLQTIVFPTLCFLGGSYSAFPDDVGGVFQIITNISPLRWTNRGIFRMAFLQDYSMITTSILLNLTISIAFIIIVLIVNKKEGALS